MKVLVPPTFPKPAHRSTAASPGTWLRSRFTGWRFLLAALWSAGTLLASRPAGRAQTAVSLTTVHNFSGSESNGPRGNLTLGDDGNFYGTTFSPGSIFKLTPSGTLTTIYQFTSGDPIVGTSPCAYVVQGSDGNFYGTTSDGGPTGGGAFFKITPAGELTVLSPLGHDAGPGVFSGLVQAGDGNFYGTSEFGGPGVDGTILQLTPTGVVTILHAFHDPDGQEPVAGLTLGADGDLYGTTTRGGDNGIGTVFKISTAGAFTVLHQFNRADGVEAFGRLVQAGDGNFYGTTRQGGAYELGTAYKVTPTGEFTLLHSFGNYNNPDGRYPYAGLIQGRDGNFYGTTSSGGSLEGDLFRMTPDGQVTVLHSFNQDDGSAPYGSLLQASDGSFYGTTCQGGSNGYGTLFRMTVSALPSSFFAGQVALGNGVYYLSLPNKNIFGYYAYLSDPRYLYHFDLGYEYVFDAADGKGGVYLYDFKSGTFFYTSPTFGFPYLYDFSLDAVLYYYPDPHNPGRYNTNGVRYFYNFKTGQTITK